MANLNVQELKDWILKQGLKEFSLEDIFSELHKQLSDEFDLYRISIGMPTLHPLVEATTLRWERHTGLEFFESEHGFSDREDWLASPISYMFEQKFTALNYRLDQPGDWNRFPLLKELAEAGCTEYYAEVISFDDDPNPSTENPDGMLTSWATDHPEGFSDKFFSTISSLLPTLGIVAKLAGRENALINILEAYFWPRCRYACCKRSN